MCKSMDMFHYLHDVKNKQLRNQYLPIPSISTINLVSFITRLFDNNTYFEYIYEILFFIKTLSKEL